MTQRSKRDKSGPDKIIEAISVTACVSAILAWMITGSLIPAAGVLVSVGVIGWFLFGQRPKK